ncbi:MAG: BamA/TamA family outer membrane protein [bacterium]|nr:BamA/TamA family outer membrane protein [bacterium]
MKKLIIVLSITFILISTSHLSAQDFGKNKVRYKNFTWQIIKTEHFDLYYSPDISYLAKKAALFAEEAYQKISNDLSYYIEKRIPFILFKSHYDFEQTNIILELIDKGVGGFAEVFKSRMVIPFTGSYKDLKIVINHELTHVFSYDILYKDTLKSILTNQFLYSPPLWFMEGIAEHETGELDSNGEMVLADAVINNYLIPISNLDQFPPSLVYLAYKESHSFLNFIAQKYGKEKLAYLIKSFAVNKNMEGLFKKIIGEDISTVENKWRIALQQKYFPQVKIRKDPSSLGRTILKNKEYAYFSLYSPGGDMLLVFANHKSHNDIFLVKEKNGAIIKNITFNLRFSLFDELKTEKRALSWSGNSIAFIAKKGGCDYIFIWDVLKSKIVKKINFKEFNTINSINLSSDEQKVVLSAQVNGYTSIFIYHLNEKTLKRITFHTLDDEPIFSPDDKNIAFVREESEFKNIYIYSLEEQKFKKIVSNQADNINPSWKDEESIYFSSNYKGRFNIFLYNLKNDQFFQVVGNLGGAFWPTSSPDKNKIAFSSYHKGSYNIFTINNKNIKVKEFNFDLNRKLTDKPKTITIPLKNANYKPKMTLDWVRGDFAYSTLSGFSANTRIAVSDILGNHRFILSTDCITSINNFKDINFYLTYLYLTKRPNIGVGIFNWGNYYYYKDEKIMDRDSGGIFFLSYPLNKYKRLDSGFLSKQQTRKYLESEKDTERDKSNLIFLSYVTDTSSWSWKGPISGRRSILTIEESFKFSKNDLKYTNYKVDLRKYFQISRESSLAMRLLYYRSNGPDPDDFFIGGSNTLRGYDYDEFRGTRMTLLNTELRFPFIKVIYFSFPLPITIKNIGATFFIDLGSTWFKDESIRLWNNNEKRIEDKFHMSIGMGIRSTLGFFPLRFDYAWKTNLRSSDKPNLEISIGYDY